MALVKLDSPAPPPDQPDQTAPPAPPSAPTPPAESSTATAPPPERKPRLLRLDPPPVPRAAAQPPQQPPPPRLQVVDTPGTGAAVAEFTGAADFWREQTRLSGQHADELLRSTEKFFHSDTVAELALAGLGIIGGAASFTFSPVEAALSTVVGRPAETALKAAGVAPQTARTVREKIAEYGAAAAQMALDPAVIGPRISTPISPIGAAVEGARALKESGFAKGLKTALTPEEVDDQSRLAASIIQSWNGKLAHATALASHAVEQYRGIINRMPEAARYQFMNALERETILSNPELQPLADEMRRQQALRWDQVRSLNGQQTVIDNYFPHIWRQRRDLTPEQEAAQLAMGRRPLRGTMTFQHPRHFETIEEGRAAGFELVTTDPIENYLIKARELDKYYYGRQMGEELKDALGHFVPTGQHAPIGYRALDDSMFRAMLPPFSKDIPGVKVLLKAMHERSFDPVIQAGLDKLGQLMGVALKYPLRKDMPHGTGSTLGFTYAPGYGPREAVSEFGQAQTVMEHEIGHNIDWHWKRQGGETLSSQIARSDPQAWRELGELGLYRAHDQLRQQALSDPAYQRMLGQHFPFSGGGDHVRYLLSSEERIANLFHAYWHAPQLLDHVAPNAKRWLESFLAADPRDPVRQTIKEIKPSLQYGMAYETEELSHTTPDIHVQGVGPQLVGQWYAPESAARVFNNYVSSGLAGKNTVYDSIRHMANALNLAQLGLSGFHASFTSVDTTVSRLALALEQAVRGEGLTALKTAASAPIAAFTTARKGGQLLHAYLNPQGATPELQRMVEAMTEAGGRHRMDWFYKATKGSGLIGSLRDGSLVRQITDEYARSPFKTVLKTPFLIAGKALQTTSHWLMEELVPRQKLGVFHDLAADYLRRNPTATGMELRQAMQTAWRSVDNRLGQMVYDNIFWNRIGKDLSFIGVRSVGWNLGTIRELGGGALDGMRALGSLYDGDIPAFTHRMAYAITLPITVGSIGAVAQYLYTGEHPRDITDYFFPRTGKNTPQGVPERVSIPSYIKDVLEYNREPITTLQHKINPVWSTLYQLWKNEDFYGGYVVDRDAPATRQMLDLLEYAVVTGEPFSVRSAQRMLKEGSSPTAVGAALMGLQPAPAFITNPARARQYEEYQAKIKRKKYERERARGLRGFASGGE